ncbi:uncharacterized protein LOC133284360, partial [Gastrolobium bilobum]|uniref:uncharacterized protein LOC133284360 n=1 Tax=Gastrolobium bilobum TaxID=150636 RepID=UPI002AAFC297
MQGTFDSTSLLFDPELERTIRRNRRAARRRQLLEREEPSGEPSTTVQEENMAENHVQPPQRTLGDYMTPAVIPPIGSVVRPTVEPNNFELKPALVQLVQKEQFAGTSAEDPYLHIENFLLLSDTVKINGVSRDAILLRLFTHSLKDDARRWLQSLPQGTGGSLTTKTPQEALDIFESLASQEFDNAPVNDRRMGIIKLDGYDALLAKNDQMQQVQKQQQQQIDSLTKQLSSQKVASVDTNFVCASCEKSHVTDDCDCGRPAEQAEVNGVWYDHNNQRNYNNQGRNVYVPPWKNKNQHPGEETSAFMQETKTTFRNQEATIRNLETQIGQLSRQIAERPQGKFPGDTMKVDEKKVGEKKSVEEVVVEDVVVENDKEEEVEEKKKEEEVVVEKSSSPKKLMKWEKKMADKKDQPINLSPYAKVPYPQRLKQEIQKQHYARFLDIFKKLQINIPFAEALENMPHYAKFTKDLLSKKRKLKDGETVALTEECSALIQKKLPPKLKDPGSFSIPIAIGDVEVGKALCDLGASINLMPLTVCRALGINTLKDTNLILHLADRSIKRPKGVVEDVL